MSDVIDEVLGLRQSDEVWQLRRTRPEVLEHLQGGYEALFGDAASSNGLTSEERAAAAAAICEFAGVEPLAAHYRELQPAGAPEGPRAAAITGWARLVAAEPQASRAEQLDELRAVGLDDAQIVTLAQLIGFVSFQLRVVVGLEQIGV